MRPVSRLFALCLLLTAYCPLPTAYCPLPTAARAAARPAVLFLGGVHATYAARPLVAMGVDVDACPRGQLAAKLAGGKYNVVVAETVNDADRKALDDFLAAGGGVFVCSPGHDFNDSKTWTATNEWLAAKGARPRWETFEDGDKANVVSDVMGCRLSFSDQVRPPVNEGVRGVLTLMWGSTTGCEPPMSFDLAPEWQVVVRGPATMKSVPALRNDIDLQPWEPKEGIPSAPPLLALRQAGKGRLAVMAIRYYWLFTPPGNCPTAEAMLTAGAGGKPSDWLRVFANTFRWLAEPSQKAGMGGAGTPDAIVNPPVQVWEPEKPVDWTTQQPMQDELQTPGLIGARTALSSGSGTVADYVRAAKAAGLQFIVFLEDSLKMDEAKWKKLVEECTAASDDAFAAVPGLTYEDAQGNHLYAFADNVQFPKPSMLLPDGRLATTKSIRTNAYFDYVNEYMGQKDIGGFWQHKANQLNVADYKLYNSFPVFSAINGKPVDSALPEYLYLQGIGGCQCLLAFEIMTDPGQVAKRARDGWRVVAHRRPADLRTKWHEGAWSFSGSGSQYVTNGPQILVWDSPARLVLPHGEWWRPDLWEYRLRLRVASDAGLRSVTIHDGDRQVLRRWLPGGAKRFEQEMVFSNCQQLAPTLVVEDMKGRRAISMSFWNRNTMREEFFCSDRCNFLGNARLKTRAGSQVWTPVGFGANMGITPSKGLLNLGVSPAVSLTLNSPTLPIDGAPAGFPTLSLNFNPQIPGERKYLFAYPQTYLVGPEMAIGQADIKLAYDPAEEGAKASPLGHPYEQPQMGWGNSWGSWHKLVPTTKVEGWARTYAANWIPEEFRIGWQEMRLVAKEAIPVDPAKGLPVLSTKGTLWRDGKQIPAGATGPFTRGTFATLEDRGGSVVVMAMDGPLEYRAGGGDFTLVYLPGKPALAKGDVIHYTVAFAGAAGGTTTERMLDFARQFGVSEPGKPGYAPAMTQGRPVDTYLVWRMDAQGKGIVARVPRAPLPGFLTACVEGLNDNWSVELLDRARKGPNHRGLPIRDGRAWAQLDLAEGDSDLFIGHPVTADNPNVKLLVSWQEPGVWFVEAHNPTARPMRLKMESTPGWTLFTFKEQIMLPAGASKVWQVKESPVAPPG